MAKNNNLTDFLTDIADAIREKKGTSEPINPQDFSDEIASIETGGGEYNIEVTDNIDDTQNLNIVDAGSSQALPSTLNGLDNLCREFLNQFVVKNTTRYTQNAITLYTPNAEFTKYYIRKRADNGLYAIIWYRPYNASSFPTSGLVLYNSSADKYTSLSYRLVLSPTGTDGRISVDTLSGTGVFPRYYYSSSFNTLEDAIAGIQSSGTTYTAYDGPASPSNNSNYIGYSNLDLCLKPNGTTEVGYEIYEFPRLSDNETIEAMS